MKRTAAIFFCALAGCVLLSPTEREIAEMRAYAYANRSTDIPDTNDVRFVADPISECEKIGTWSMRYKVAGCTFLGARPYSILGFNATALDIAHEATHRTWGDWHSGAYYFTTRQWDHMLSRPLR